MHSWILLVMLLGFVVAEMQKAIYECPEKLTITPKHSINTSAIYTFPTKAYTQFPENAACSWLINVPTNYTAIVQLKATIPDGGHVSVTQSPFFNETEKFITDMEVTRFFNPPNFDIFWYPGTSDGGNLKFSLQFQEVESLLEEEDDN